MLLTDMLCTFVEMSGTPKHVSAEDVELFRQACHMLRQVSNFHFIHFFAILTINATITLL